MCGIAGFWAAGPDELDRMRAIVTAMTDAIAHRGPDDSGAWCDAGTGLALGSRRLAILDLSPGGHQPMTSRDGRIVVAFNGEIYNHRDLRGRLAAEGVCFRSRSDTEVLVEAVARWGLERALAELNGMFAMAVWDRYAGALALVRDRMGEKPLYWSWRDGTLLFGSELKALRRHPSFRDVLDHESMAAMVQLSFVPAPWTIYQDVRQLEPGCGIRLVRGRAPEPFRYWSAEEAALQGLAQPLQGRADEAIEQAETLIADAVRLRLEADVPLGIFLSGGIDSSAVAAFAQAAAARPVHSFSIGFAEDEHDESADAARVAAHLGTVHRRLQVTAADALALIPRLPDIFDEPFADSSQIPTFLLCQLARPEVTVALSGDGGDELFAGYSRHLWADRIAAARTMPSGLRHVLAGVLRAPSPAGWTRAASLLPVTVPRHLGDKIHKTAAALVAGTGQLYADLLTAGRNRGLVEGAGLGRWLAQLEASGTGRALEEVQLLDQRHYLPDDILTKADRASMAVSLEVRAPLLDHRLVEFAWRLPRAWKLHRGQGKRLLRDVLYRKVPRTLVDRPKSGFSLPLGEWLRGPLRDWAEPLLSASALEQAGLAAAPVQAAWQRHLSGATNEAEALWSVLMLTAWLQAR